MTDASDAAARSPAAAPTDRGGATISTPTPTPTSTDGSLVARLRAAAHPLDLAVLLAVPVVLAAAALLPPDARLALAFSYTDPTLRTAFGANFLHVSPDHLLSNLATYALLAPTVYLLSVLSDRRDRFYVVFVSFLVVFPAVLSVLNLAILRRGVLLGFSGVNAAFVGYLPLALAGYLRSVFGVRAERELAAGLFFLGLALVAVLVVRTPVTYAVAAVATLAAVGRLRAVDAGPPRSRDALGAPGEAELAAVAVILLFGGLLCAFPPDPVVAGAIVNVYVHLVGFALGFIAPFVTFGLAPAVERSRAVAALREYHIPVRAHARIVPSVPPRPTASPPARHPDAAGTVPRTTAASARWW